MAGFFGAVVLVHCAQYGIGLGILGRELLEQVGDLFTGEQHHAEQRRAPHEDADHEVDEEPHARVVEGILGGGRDLLAQP